MIRMKNILSEQMFKKKNKKTDNAKSREQLDQEWAEKHGCVGDEFIIGKAQSSDMGFCRSEALQDVKFKAAEKKAGASTFNNVTISLGSDYTLVKESVFQLANGDYYCLVCYKPND